MAIPSTEPYFLAEIIPDPLAEFMYALAAHFGAPRTAVGMKGNSTHYAGAHRSWNFCRYSRYCPDSRRLYTTSRTPGDLNPPNKNAIAGGDLTLPEEKLILLCRRLDAAVRSGLFEGVTEWYGNRDGDDLVDGFDNIADAVASSDSTHLWHLHMTFDRAIVWSREFFARLLRVLTGEDEPVTPAEIEQIATRTRDLLLATNVPLIPAMTGGQDKGPLGAVLGVTLSRVCAVQTAQSGDELRDGELLAAVHADQVATISPDQVAAMIGAVVDGVVGRLDVELDAARVEQIKVELREDLVTRIENG